MDETNIRSSLNLTKLELDCNLQSISCSMEAVCQKNTASWQVRSTLTISRKRVGHGAASQPCIVTRHYQNWCGYEYKQSEQQYDLHITGHLHELTPRVSFSLPAFSPVGARSFQFTMRDAFNNPG